MPRATDPAESTPPQGGPRNYLFDPDGVIADAVVDAATAAWRGPAGDDVPDSVGDKLRERFGVEALRAAAARHPSVLGLWARVQGKEIGVVIEPVLRGEPQLLPASGTITTQHGDVEITAMAEPETGTGVGTMSGWDKTLLETSLYTQYVRDGALRVDEIQPEPTAPVAGTETLERSILRHLKNRPSTIVERKLVNDPERIARRLDAMLEGFRAANPDLVFPPAAGEPRRRAGRLVVRWRHQDAVQDLHQSPGRH